MKKIAIISVPFTLAILLGVGSLGYAQSSGNFSASATAAACSIGPGGVFKGGTAITLWESDISTSNGNGVTLKITPSAVTGLFTKTKISTSVPTASADVGIQFCVKVDGKGNEDGAGILPDDCVVYDQRFQQISSNLFSQIAECNTVVCTTTADCTRAGLTDATCFNATGLTGGGVCVVPTADTCATTADCPAGQTCIVPAGATTGTCNQVAGVANDLCDFELILSTLSAHSFDFVVPVGKGKPHKVTVQWSVIGAGASGATASVASCVGPGMVTVEQMKVFNNSGALLEF